MGLGKDMFIAAQEELYHECFEALIADGVNEDDADEQAAEWVDSREGCDRAETRAGDNLGDMIDHAMDLRKEGLL